MKKLEGKVVVWPSYLDSSRLRRDGRRLPKRLGVEAPLLKDILESALSLGLKPEAHSEARYPKSWWDVSGYMIVDKMESKRKTLELIASKVREFKASAPPRKV